MKLPILTLKKNEDRRLRAGHLWIFSNEIDTRKTPLKQFSPGQAVNVHASNDTYLGTAYINPHSLITARIFSRDPDSNLDDHLIKKRLLAALTLRMNLFKKPYYRLFFSESDFLPGLIIDRFENYLVLQINTVGMDNKTDSIIASLLELIPETQGILLRNDTSARTLEGLPTSIQSIYGTIPSDIILEENTVQFHALLTEGQKTGWFYDHRLNRSRLTPYVGNKRVLDVFSYLGAWGIQAACFGAKQVICLDSSPLSLHWIPKNAALNQVADKVNVIQDDAFQGLKKLQQDNELFDVIILDPPAFAKRQKDKNEGSIAYQRVNELALKLLHPGGILFTCSCSQAISDEEWSNILRKAGQRSHCDIQILERGHQAPDHPVHPAIPETDYLKMIVARKLER